MPVDKSPLVFFRRAFTVLPATPAEFGRLGCIISGSSEANATAPGAVAGTVARRPLPLGKVWDIPEEVRRLEFVRTCCITVSGSFAATATAPWTVARAVVQ